MSYWKMEYLSKIKGSHQHAYHFKIALQRLWQVNVSIAESCLNKWISCIQVKNARYS